jgi:hypothetical protein
MLPIPQFLLFVPFTVFALLFVAGAAICLRAGRHKPAKPAPLRPQAALPSAQIIYFRPRQTSLPSGLRLGVR